MAGDKTEKATPKRLREARREGRIARSQDVGSWAGILVASALLPPFCRKLAGVFGMMIAQLRAIIADPHPDPARTLTLLGAGAKAGAIVLAPLSATLLLIGVAAAAAQGGIHPSTKMLAPKTTRLNPLKGIRRVFGTQAMWETVKATLKVAVIGLVLYHVVRKLIPTLLEAGSVPLLSIVDAVSGAVLALVRAAALAGLVLAAGDYAFIRRKNNKQLKMSKQEIKEEHRQSEGDPHMKGEIRSRQLRASRNRMMADLSEADVVVVNPAHVAVALRYDPLRGAPRVLAKGAGEVARRIREAATERRIPLVADVELARALYKDCDIGQEIPADLYTAVARVLAFVLNLRSRGSAAGTHQVPDPAGPPAPA
jgi:flagellar biosynthesis protein FlhB